MKTTGKILLSLVLANTLYAEVKSGLREHSIRDGDYNGFYIEAPSNNAVFPKINEINGAKVFSTTYSNTLKLDKDKNETAFSRIDYYFYPINDDVIPPFKVIVDGKEEMTKEHKFSLIKREKRASDLNITLNKNEIFLGEIVVLELNLSYKQNDVSRTILNPTKFENFEILDYQELPNILKNDKVIQKARYTLKPKKVGDMAIEPLTANVVEIKDDGNLVVKEHSNNLLLKVIFPPQNLVGNFKIKVEVDKSNVKAGKPVNVEYIINGSGNLDDIDDINLIANGANIFKESAKIDKTIQNGVINGQFRQKFSIVGDKSFTIQGFEIPYFNPETNATSVLKANDIQIDINNKKIRNFTLKDLSIYATLSFFGGVLTSLIAIFSYKNRSKIYKTKEYKLRELLRFYGLDKQLDEEIEKLEDNIKFGKSNKIDYKLISKSINSIKKGS